ncbi:hypothetical protein EXIGLDRAFT_199675 [Exidia glandulosa HHB12029]|uniref:Uncharacterized protein n=1 Tax=Exidia glandulosa HHB12029 TaxID=1314781 RepID=A0A165ESD1_EXIGL|nr:hypothetical protein EXIGLDRAFT_199675 [Exidia glandulosa HHB12029]
MRVSPTPGHKSILSTSRAPYHSLLLLSLWSGCVRCSVLVLRVRICSTFSCPLVPRHPHLTSHNSIPSPYFGYYASSTLFSCIIYTFLGPTRYPHTECRIPDDGLDVRGHEYPVRFVGDGLMVRTLRQ